MNRIVLFMAISAIVLTGCGKEEISNDSTANDTGIVSEATADANPTTGQETEPVEIEEESGGESVNEDVTESEKISDASGSEQTGTKSQDTEPPVIGTWVQTDEDEEITALIFNDDGTYTYTFDHSRAYEEGDEIDEEPVSGESEQFKYFLDSEYVIKLEDTVLTMINMVMDENLELYGNCGIYDSAANAIYIGESFNNVLMRFVQQEHTTQKEWLEYIDDEYYLTFVR